MSSADDPQKLPPGRDSKGSAAADGGPLEAGRIDGLTDDPRLVAAARALNVTIRNLPPAAAGQPIVYDPTQPDDLTRLRRIDRTLAERLQRFGINHFEQIAGWTAVDVRSLSAALGLGDRIYRENWIEQAAMHVAKRRPAHAPARGPAPVAAAPSISKAAALPPVIVSAESPVLPNEGAGPPPGEPGEADAPHHLPVVSGPPRDKTDEPAKPSLRALIAGVAAGIAARLRKEAEPGALRPTVTPSHAYRQPEVRPPSQVELEASVAAVIGRIATRLPSVSAPLPAASPQPVAEAPSSADAGLSAPELAPDPAATAPLDVIPPVIDRAEEPDAVPGQSPAIDPELEIETAQAPEAPPLGEEEPSADEEPISRPAEPAAPDDFTLIAHMPPEVADALLAIGVTRYSEIASFDQGDVASLSADFALGNRINREGWIEQAALLASGRRSCAARRIMAGRPQTVASPGKALPFPDLALMSALVPATKPGPVAFRARPVARFDTPEPAPVPAARPAPTPADETGATAARVPLSSLETIRFKHGRTAVPAETAASNEPVSEAPAAVPQPEPATNGAPAPAASPPEPKDLEEIGAAIQDPTTAGLELDAQYPADSTERRFAEPELPQFEEAEVVIRRRQPVGEEPAGADISAASSWNGTSPAQENDDMGRDAAFAMPGSLKSKLDGALAPGELDAESYAAYHDAIDEASVEIVRRSGAQRAASKVVGNASDGRPAPDRGDERPDASVSRFLKALKGR